MAVILKFPSEARASAPAEPGAGGAQILFFTGVRYERAAAKRKAKAPRRQRRRRKKSA